MGYSYTIEAHLLLVVHDPTVPKLGPLRRRAVADMDVSIPYSFFQQASNGIYSNRREQRKMFEIFAVWLNQMNLLPQQASLLAWRSHYVSAGCRRHYLFRTSSPTSPLTSATPVGGDRFIHLSEQQQLYDFLYTTEKSHGWPTAKARSQLQEAWGWESRGSNGGTPAAVHPANAAMTPPP